MLRKSDRYVFKMTPEQLSSWEACQKRTSVVPARKGNKGVRKRTDNKLKNEIRNQIDER